MKFRIFSASLTGFLICSTGLLFAQKADPRHFDIENIGKRDINKGNTNFTSLEKESVIGRQAAAEFEQNATLLNDAAVLSYVDKVAQNIARNSDSRFPITVKVIYSNTVNAYALPGGFIYLSLGLIESADNEAELAFAIAQMVGHVAARHATELPAKGNLLQVAAIPAVIFPGGVASIALQSSQVDTPIGMLKFHQAAVEEADLLGLEYLYKSGYDPAAAVHFFKDLQAAEPASKQNTLFAPYLPTAKRIEQTMTNIEKILPIRANNILNTPEFDAIQSKLKNKP